MKDRIIRDIRNLFRLEKEIKAIKYRIIRNIRNLFEYEEEENYYKLVRVSNFWSKGDRKTLSAEEYLNKIRPYFKDIENIKKYDT